MISAYSGFVNIGLVVLLGWAVGRWGGLPDNAEAVLGRLVYSVLAPCLLFAAVADAHLGVLFSEPLIVSAAAACACFALYALLARGRDTGTRILGALSAGYVNANYVGIPVATAVLGNAALVVPILVLQLLVVTPIALAGLDLTASRDVSVRTILLATLRNPLILSVALGAVASLTHVRPPSVFTTVGQAAVPLVLIAFGLSLSGRRLLGPGSDKAGVLIAATLKAVVMPLIAFLLAVALRLSRQDTYAVTVLAALPAAQNVFLYAQRAGVALVLVRDAVFLSTLACVPVLLLITLLFQLR